MNASKLLGTTSFKLSALYLGLFLCSFLAIGITVHLLTTHVLEQQLKGSIEAELARLKTEFDAGGLSELNAEINEIINTNPRVAYFYGVLDQDGQLLAGNYGDFKLIVGWQTAVRPATQDTVEHLPETLALRVIALPGRLWLGVGHNSSYIDAAEEAIIEAFLWGFLLVLALGMAGGFYLSRAFLKKIGGITQATQSIIAGDLHHRLAITANHDELDNLALLLNQMLDKICALIENVQQVSNDIAHDLRTPVSRLKFRLENMLEAELDEPDYKKQVALAIAEVDTILDTFSALLRISQIESKSRCSGFKAFDLAQTVADVADALIPVAEEQGKTITVRPAKPCRLVGDQELLTQVVFNLMENAIVHTPEQTRIAVDLNDSGKTIELTVTDNGLGIDETYQQKVFQRFYRLEQSRSTAGNGLGLSIVAAIIDLHNGSISLADNKPGLKVTVSLPKPPEAKTAPHRQQAIQPGQRPRKLSTLSAKTVKEKL